MLSWLTGSIEPRALGLARVMVGIAALIRSTVALRVLVDLTDPQVLKTPFVDWLPSPTIPLVAVVISVWVASSILFALGWHAGLSGGALLVSIVTTIALDQQAYSNHLYLLGWLVLLLVIADAGAGMSIRSTDRPVMRWPVLLIMAQASIVYGFSGLTKLNDSFLSGEVLAGVLRGGPVAFPDALRTPAFLSSLALVVILVEISVAMFLWVSRFRPVAFILGLGLHLAIVLLMEPTVELIVFSLEMLALYPLFLPDEKLHLTVGVEDGAHRGLVRIVRRFDLLHSVSIVERSDTADPPVLEHLGATTSGFDATTRVLEHLVPTLWVAPILRTPGISHLGRWLFDRRVRALVSTSS